MTRRLDAARILALLRIVVCAIILISPEPFVARSVAAREMALRFAPEGLAWLVPFVTPGAIVVATLVLQASAVVALLGIARRVSLAILAVAFFYVFGASQLTGTVTHDMHLLWFVVLLAMTRDRNAAFSLRVARTWLGLVYFFPGLHKLLDTGPSWITSDNLRNQMWFKWFEATGEVPALRIDHAPWLLHGLAAAVIAFELAMPFLVQHRRTRPVALLGAIGFHLGAGYWLGVLFPSLLACLVVLLPDRARERAPVRRASCWRLAVVAAMTAAIVIQGLRGQTQSYPFACYPTFAGIAPATIVDLAVDRVEGEETTTFRLPARRRPDEWGHVWELAGLYGHPPSPRALDAFAEQLGHRTAGTTELRVVRETYDVRPESFGAPPLARETLRLLE